MAAVSPDARVSREQGPWLYGRSIDLLIGCCGIYTLSIPLLLALTMGTEIRSWSVGFTIFLAVMINAPHYGATLVRLYERRPARRKYFVFTVYVTLAVVALFVVATRNLWLESALITAYIVWSPWHFSAQNYGLLLMFLRREKVAFDDTTKRLFYASFLFATAMSIEGVLAASSDLVFAPATFKAPGTPQIFQWAFLQENANPLLWALGTMYVATLGAALVRMRGSGFRLIGPASLILLTQAFFTAVPVVAARVVTTGEINFAFAPVWISMAHSAQYLWVSAYFAKRSGAQRGSARFLGKSFLAGSGVTVLPALLFAPALLGDAAWDAGLAGLVFAMVNLHHFIMDGAIWKLRDGSVGNILLRDSGVERGTYSSRGRGNWLAGTIWTACTLSLIVPVTHIYVIEIKIPNARTNEDISRALDHLRLIGRESIALQNYVGSVYSELDRPQVAIEHYERSIELHPTPDAYTGLGNERRRLGEHARARTEYERALRLDPDFALALFGYAASLALDDANPTAGDLDRAELMLGRVLEVHPEQAEAKELLRSIKRRRSR